MGAEQPRLKVLIVDDNPLNLRVMKQLLKTRLAAFLDIDALQTANSGYQALDLLRTHHFHLLFLDISMPGISGLEVCQRLRNGNHPSSKLHICAVTTDLADWQVQLYKSFLMDGVIGKPLKSHDLEFALRACLESILCQQNPELLKPAFYFLRHGAHQVLPDLTIYPPSPTYPAQPVPSSSSTTITIPSNIPLPSSSTALSPTRCSSRPSDQRNFRQQSVVSEASVAGVLACYEPTPLPPIPRPCPDQAELVDETLLPDCRPSFDSFNTFSCSGSIITCSSSCPTSATAIDPLSPSYASEEDDPFEHAQCFPAFPTAPIIVSTHVPLGLRSPRRWSSPLYTLSSPSVDSPLAREENDVFAAGFQAAMNHMTIDQACSRWGKACFSAASSSAHNSIYGSLDQGNSTTTPRNMSRWVEEEEDLRAAEEQAEVDEEEGQGLDDHRWARLAGPIAGDDATSLSSVTRQLISRRSHPMLRLHHLDRTQTSTSESIPAFALETLPESPFMRKSKSAAGLPIRPSWQLVQLSTINYQSVLQSGSLLDEVLLALDLADHHHANP